MNANYEVLKEELKEAEITKLQDTIKVIFPNHLMFNTGSSEIFASIQSLFVRFGKALNQYDKTQILISGHTDNTGDENRNVDLSLQRALAAKTKLVSESVDSNRLFTWGVGSRVPLASNAVEEGRARNRRVEFIVLYAPKKKD